MVKVAKKVKTITKHAFKATWEHVKIAPTITEDGHKSMYKWQKKAWRKLKKALNWLLNAPMGSGKSLAIQFIACSRLIEDSNLKVIIAVPQLNIGFGFQREQLQFPDGTQVNFTPYHNLCSDSAESNINQLIEGFLKAKLSKNTLMDRVCVCSHATLVQAFQKDPEAFKDILVVIDEAHHIQYGKVQLNNDAGEIEIANKLGDLVKYCIKNGDKKNISLGLTTATYFRGDRCPIVPKGCMKLFKRSNLPYDEYLQTMKYLRGYSFDFVLFGNSFADAVKERFAKKVNKSIVYIPPVGSSYSSGDKHQDVYKVYESIAQKKNPEIVNQRDGVTKVKRGNKWIKVVNLVDEKNRKEKQRIIEADHNSEESNIDVIIALGMFKEGANWKHAEECLIIGHRGSLVELIQCMGRLFRDKKGKTHVSVYQLLPFSFHQVKDKEKFREGLNTLMKAILASMLLENVMLPISVPVPSKKRGKKGTGQKRLSAMDLFVDESQFVRISNEIVFKVVELMDTDKEAQKDTKVFYKKYLKLVEKTLKDNDIPVSDAKPVADILWAMWQRSCVQNIGLDVDGINFNIIKKDDNPFSLIIRYTTDLCGIDTFRAFRQALSSSYFYPFEEAREIMHKMRADGQPIDTMAEYNVWTRSDHSYDAVLEYRNK